MVATSNAMRNNTTRNDTTHHMKGLAMIISHSEELHYPVKLDLRRTEYYDATLEVNFKASTLNNARWEVIYHDSEQIEMVSYDPHASIHQTHPTCLLYTSPSPRDRTRSRMPSSA